MRKVVVLGMGAALVCGGAVALTENGPPYPQLTREMIAPCEAQFATLQREWAQVLEENARQYEPGGSFHFPTTGLTPEQARRQQQDDAAAARGYRSQAAQARARSPIQFYIDGWRMDGEPFGSSLSDTNRDLDSSRIDGWRWRQANGPDSDLSAYERARFQAERCVGRAYLAIYDAQRAPTPDRDAAPRQADSRPGAAQTYVDDDGRACLTAQAPVREPSGGNHYYRHRQTLNNHCGFPITVVFTETPQSEGSPVEVTRRVAAKVEDRPGEASHTCLQHRGGLSPTGCEGVGWREVVD